MEKSVLHVIDYFHKYQYPPTIEEVWKYLDTKISFEKLEKKIDVLVSKKILLRNGNRISKLNQYFEEYKKREKISLERYQELKNIKTYLKMVPYISLIGVSGSLSMKNNKEKSDTDLFVISKRNRIWTARFILLLIKKISILFGSHVRMRLCFNLFFSEASMMLAHTKRSEYTAHEVLQMKPFLDKQNTYQNFLYENRWVEKYFPNVQINTEILQSKDYAQITGRIGDLIENIIEKVQKWWLDRKGITYREERGQVWFIQEVTEIL